MCLQVKTNCQKIYQLIIYIEDTGLFAKICLIIAIWFGLMGFMITYGKSQNTSDALNVGVLSALFGFCLSIILSWVIIILLFIEYNCVSLYRHYCGQFIPRMFPRSYQQVVNQQVVN